MTYRVTTQANTVTRRDFMISTTARIGLATASAPAFFERALGKDALASSEKTAVDVAWLDEVQRPPVERPVTTGRLRSLLLQPDGTPITTVSQWTRERARLRTKWLDFLGPMPVERPPTKLKILKEDYPPGCTRQLVRYESEPGLPVEGYLLRPVSGRARKLRPGIVALHGTSPTNIDDIAGHSGPASKHLGLRLAQRGFVVFCPRCFLWQDVESYDEAVDKFRKRHPKTLGMHKMLWDAMRAVDVLISLSDEVDPQRIGAAGHSLGGKESLYLAAFDERIQAAVASEGGIGLASTNWDAPWYLGQTIHSDTFSLDHHQLLALIAPRPFLILAGERGRGAVDGNRSWPYVEAALPVYRLYGNPCRLGLYNHGEGHVISDTSFERLSEWLMCYVRARSK